MGILCSHSSATNSRTSNVTWNSTYPFRRTFYQRRPCYSASTRIESSDYSVGNAGGDRMTADPHYLQPPNVIPLASNNPYLAIYVSNSKSGEVSNKLFSN